MDKNWRAIDQWRRDDLNANSIRLAMALDAIGFSEKTRETATDYAVLHDIFYTIKNILCHRNHCRATMGSRREGTTNNMLQSDHDVIHYDPLLRIFETVQLKTNCAFNTHLITVNDSRTPIGYTKIQLVQNGKIVRSITEIVGKEKNDMNHFEKFKEDQSGRFVLSNQFNLQNDTQMHARNGPADTISYKCRQSIDNVPAYLFDDIPKAMSPWFTRSRPQGWPSKETLELCKRMGCFVVPVGQANSKERNLEWRLSMSFQERYLMLNLNEAQYKCYILLKLIKKFLIKPRFGDILSSYHCKTCLLYTIEKVGTKSWTTLNLLKNLIRCLEQMLQWLINGICPNFFVADENMFASRLNKHNQCGVINYFESLIKTNCIDLLQIKFEDFRTFLFIADDLTYFIKRTFLTNETIFAKGAHSELYAIFKIGVSNDQSYFLDLMQHNYGKCFDIVKSYMQGSTILAEICMTTLNSENRLKRVKVSLLNAITFLHFCQGEIENNSDGETIIPIELAMRYIFNSFSLLKQSSEVQNSLKSIKIHYSHSREKQLILKGIQLARTKILTDIANLLVVEYVRTKSSSDSLELFLKSTNYFEKGKSVNYLTNRLKLARFLFIRHMYRQCHNLLNQLIIIEKETIHTCICYDCNLHGYQSPDSKIFRLTQQRIVLSLWSDQNEDNRVNMRAQLIANNFTNCVIYDYYELEAINAPLCYEAFRLFGTPIHAKVFEYDFWLSRAVIDPVVYLNFMLIECSDQLNEIGGSAASLGMLENLLFMNCSNSLRHLETAINIVGHLYVKKGWNKLAKECYRKSLTVRPLHNAAKWNIMFMLFGQ